MGEFFFNFLSFRRIVCKSVLVQYIPYTWIHKQIRINPCQSYKFS